MERKLLLGIDIGTYESKGVLCTPEGQVVASAAIGHELSVPRPGWAEHDADNVWWHDFVVLCRELLAAPHVEAAQVIGVGVSAIAPCVLPVDKYGQPLRPGILYGVDTRATKEIAELEKEFGRETILAGSGVRLSSQAAGPKILWIRNNEPDVWANSAMFLTASGYLVFRLTGENVIDIYTGSAYAPLFDVRNASWNAELAGPITPLERLPRLSWSVEVAGYVTPAAAKETGLTAGTPVITGTADAAAEGLSAGLSQNDDLMLMYGSSMFFIQKTGNLARSSVFWGHAFLEPDTYVVTGGMSTSGSITRWFRDNFGASEVNTESSTGRNAYEELAALAAGSPVGARGLILLPYFSGERSPINDPAARGMVIGLTLKHSRADLYRAILEGVGYGIRHNIDVMREEHIASGRILAVGGGTKNPLWLQIVSDIAGIDQYVPDQNYGAAFGDAFMAGIGIGVFRDTRQISNWIRYRSLIKPKPDVHQQYESYYQLYRKLYQDNSESMHRLAYLANT
jgi:xylulokinase